MLVNDGYAPHSRAYVVTQTHSTSGNKSSYRPQTIEQFIITSQRCGLIIQSIPASTKDNVFGQCGHGEVCCLDISVLSRYDLI